MSGIILVTVIAGILVGIVVIAWNVVMCELEVRSAEHGEKK